jgi:hypothetical protein
LIEITKSPAETTKTLRVRSKDTKKAFKVIGGAADGERRGACGAMRGAYASCRDPRALRWPLALEGLARRARSTHAGRHAGRLVEWAHSDFAISAKPILAVFVFAKPSW